MESSSMSQIKVILELPDRVYTGYKIILVNSEGGFCIARFSEISLQGRRK